MDKVLNWSMAGSLGNMVGSETVRQLAGQCSGGWVVSTSGLAGGLLVDLMVGFLNGYMTGGWMGLEADKAIYYRKE